MILLVIVIMIGVLVSLPRLDKLDIQNKSYRVKFNKYTNKLYVEYTGDKEYGIINIKEPNGSVNGSTYMIYKGDEQVIPLVYGKGSYSISICRLTGGRLVAEERLKYDVTKDVDIGVFNGDGYYIEETKKVKKLAKKLKAVNEEDTVKNVYNYIVNNIRYDEKLADDIQAKDIKVYKPELNDVIDKQSGICIDQASLMASILRVDGIPARICEGFNENKQPHAWIQVYIEGEWKSYDTTLKRDYTNNIFNQYKVTRYY